MVENANMITACESSVFKHFCSLKNDVKAVMLHLLNLFQHHMDLRQA